MVDCLFLFWGAVVVRKIKSNSPGVEHWMPIWNSVSPGTERGEGRAIKWNRNSFPNSLQRTLKCIIWLVLDPRTLSVVFGGCFAREWERITNQERGRNIQGRVRFIGPGGCKPASPGPSPLSEPGLEKPCRGGWVEAGERRSPQTTVFKQVDNHLARVSLMS